MTFRRLRGDLMAGAWFEGIIAFASLNRQLFTRVQPDFQFVKFAIELRRRESQDVMYLG